MNASISFNTRKIIIISGLGLIFAAFSLSGFIFWQKEKQQVIVPQQILSLPPLSQKGIFEVSAIIEIQDPKEGNSGEIKIELDLTKDTPEISWPSDYTLRSFKLYWLGFQKENFDNMVIWDFYLPEWFQTPGARVPEFGKPPLLFSKEPLPGIVVLQPLDANLLLNKNNLRFVVEAYFQKEGENKIYKGIYGFKH